MAPSATSIRQFSPITLWATEPSRRPRGMKTEASPESMPRCLDGTNSWT